MWFVVLLAILGVAFLVPAVVCFAREKTTVNPLSPDEATVLVDSGVFAISRNPMYVGMLLLLLAFVLWLGSVSSLVAVLFFFVLIDRLQIRLEEEVLRKKFGKSYRQYASRVPRWLIFKGNEHE